MAAPDQLTATTLPYYRKSAQNLWYLGSPLMAKTVMSAKKGDRLLDGGEKLRFPVTYARGANRKWYKGATPLKIDTQETVTHTEVQWSHFNDAVVIPVTDILKNSGKQRVIDLFKNKKDELVKSVQEAIATQLYGAQAGDTMLGLEDVLAKDVAFMSIDPATIARWNPVVDAATAIPTYKAIHNFLYEVSEDGTPEHMPDGMYCDRALFAAIEGLFQPQQRICDEEMLKAGFAANFTIDRVPVSLDVYAKAKHLYFLNSNNLRVYIHRDDNFITEAPPRPAGQRVNIVQMFVTLQMGCNDRKHLGVMTVLDPALA